MDRSLSSLGSRARRIAACIGSLLFVLPLLGSQDAGAQAPASDEVVIFVLDLSGSMNEPFDANRTKLDVAKAAFIEAFANVSPDARVGVRTYGDQIAPTDPASRQASCTTDTRVVTPVAPLQRDQLISQVQGFTALGDTPMGLALERASGDIPAGSTGTIVLFSDGRDECYDADLDGDPAVGPSYGQDPCAIAKAITAGDAAVDRVVTVGFRADAAAETELRCIADSTGGSYTAIETPEDARDALPELLVQLSAPREAQRLVGREIRGATTTEEAPDLVRLDEIFANKVLYTDSIDMNSVRIYRMPVYGPEGGTFTATVFGLPAELGIALDMRILIPSLDQRFFQGEHGNFDAGLPASPTTSIRCTDCTISGGPYEAFFVVTLDTENPTLTGTYELEILTEGPGFGGRTTSCSAPQACFYPQEIIDQRAAVETIQTELDAGVGVPAPADLIAERDRLRDEFRDTQDAIGAAETRAAELEAQIASAPPKSKSFRLPLLMIVAGVAFAFAPVQKLKGDPKEPEPADGKGDDSKGDGGGEEKKPDRKTARRQRAKEAAEKAEADKAAASTSEQNDRSGKTSEGLPIPMSAPTATGPSLDVGPAPAINPNLKESGNHWDAELEAAKEALAQQRPSRPETATEVTTIASATAPAAGPPAATAPAAGPPQGQFSAAQHAAAKAAAQQIAAQRAQEIDAAKALDTPSPVAAPHEFSSPQTPPQPAAAIQAATPEQIAALRAAASDTTPAAQTPASSGEAAPDPDQAEREAAEEAAAEQAATAAAERAAAEQAAAKRAAAERAAAERATADQAATAERAAADQAATAERAAAERAAAEQAAAKQAAAERAAADQAATDQAAAEQAAQQATARAAAEQAAAEAAASEAADRAAEEHELRAAAEARAVQVAAERAAAEKAEADRLAAEQIAAAEKAAAEQAAREAAEKAAAEEAARLAAEQAAREQAEREAAERAAAEKAAREAAEKAAAEQAAREAAEEAARLAAEQAAREQAEREAAEKAAERAAAEQAARLAAERLAAEKAAAEKATAERAASEQAALEAAERAAADRAAAEQAAQDRAIAEQAARDAAQRLATETAAAEKAATDRAAAEEAAREAAIQRAAAEEAALEAAAERAAQEAAAEAAALVDGASDGEQKQSMTEEEQRQEARRRMLAKQNIVASSSSDGSAGAATRLDTAGTSAALRPMTVPPSAAPGTSHVERAAPDVPGWYDDPAIVGQFRWWDGGTWTGHTAADDQGAPPG